MSFLYPRTIAITRPRKDASDAVGAQPIYAATDDATETEIASDLPASIQLQRGGERGSTGLPNSARETKWDVLIPLGALANGAITEGDIITDDNSDRYEVLAAYWDSLGYCLTASKLRV